MILPPILDISIKENSHFNSSKMPESTPLYPSNSIAFANVPTPTSDHHLVHVR
jgi:hypothetical protein